MISVEEALNIVENNCNSTTKTDTLRVTEAAGYILSKDVMSLINMPPFRQSAVDGYAVNLHNNYTYNIIGEVKAGDNFHPILNDGDAVRIFTGAPVPDSANAIVMQEKTSVENAVLTIESQLSINANIRALGEQIHENETALKKGTHLTPAAIAFLASLGITEVEVFTKPSIVIVVTGNELVTPGNKLEYGQIYESNAIMLQSALKQSGYHDISVFKVNDDYNNTVNMLDKAISNHDLVLVSGGISVGDYDFVGKALNELDVEQLFYKVKQKPGKPLFFGKKDRKIIFALPGNPAAVLSCFYIYALPTLNALSGNTWQSLSRTKVKSKSNYIKKGDRAQFLKAIYNDGLVEILDGQNSSMVHTFSLANALVYINENDGSVKIDDFVDAILLPIH